jgi:hypothetical protein
MKKSQEYSKEGSNMSNPFLNKTDLMERDVETAILLEQAIVHDLGKAVAYTDGTQTYINTDDNLFNILPAYDHRMLKWLLWHEKMHIELRHHNRFFKYVSELNEEDTIDEFKVTKDEVNIIMDILVHDWMAKKFPELVEIAGLNLAQFRNRNSLKYTFKTSTLEEMLEEYKSHKSDSSDKSDGRGESGDETTEEQQEGSEEEGEEKDHSESKESGTPPKERAEDRDPEIKDESERPVLPEEHDKTDWSKLDEIDSKEFITEEESDEIQRAIQKLRRKKFRLAKLTETLNGLVTSTRMRTYAKPSSIKLSGGAILKGSTPGRTQLYLVFDASGSMSSEMDTFKEIISKSIPQAMDTPCEWFAGRNYSSDIEPYKTECMDGYYKSKFKDFMQTYASSGYDDDGDRTIELCWLAEQKGYSPIGVTDGGGQISWSKDKLKQLKRTVFVGQNARWLQAAKNINPRIQILDI